MTETTTSIASSRPGGTSSASTSRSTARAGFVREHDGLVGFAQAQVGEDEVGLVAVVGGDERDRGGDLVAGDRVERVRVRSLQASAACWRMYSAVPATNPSTSLAFPVT